MVSRKQLMVFVANNENSVLKQNLSWVLVAHSCNPSYSEDRDQEDRGSKPAQANHSMRPCLKKTLHKNRAGGVAQGKGPVL
jgi:hypothetical protein